MAYNPNQRPMNRPFLDDNLYPKLGVCVQGKFRGHRPLNANKGRMESVGYRVDTSNGWHRGQVTRGRQVIWCSPPTRDRNEAMLKARKVFERVRRR